jgi:hypothetical protein
MNRKAKAGVVITAVILITFVLIYVHRSARSPVSSTPPDIKKSSTNIRKAPTLYPGIDEVKSRKHMSFPEESKHAIVPKNVHRKVSTLINDLTNPKLSKVERNRIEHLLGSNQDKSIDKEIRIMLEDGLLDLSEQNRAGMARLTSAIRIAGLRTDSNSVEGIINICTHPETNEDVRMAGYEALGYMGTETANEFLRKELFLGQSGFLQSQIVLSLGTAEDRESSQQFLSYLDHPDPDLRDSAIISLGKIKEVRAVPKFKELYEKTTGSSRALIVQALRDIGSLDASDLLSKISEEAMNYQYTKDEYLVSRIRSYE